MRQKQKDNKSCRRVYITLATQFHRWAWPHQEYVSAGKYKDQIDLIINFTKKQGKSVASFDDRDIIAISSKNNGFGNGIYLEVPRLKYPIPLFTYPYDITVE